MPSSQQLPAQSQGMRLAQVAPPSREKAKPIAVQPATTCTEPRHASGSGCALSLKSTSSEEPSLSVSLSHCSRSGAQPVSCIFCSICSAGVAGMLASSRGRAGAAAELQVPSLLPGPCRRVLVAVGRRVACYCATTAVVVGAVGPRRARVGVRGWGHPFGDRRRQPDRGP